MYVYILVYILYVCLEASKGVAANQFIKRQGNLTYIIQYNRNQMFFFQETFKRFAKFKVPKSTNLDFRIVN